MSNDLMENNTTLLKRYIFQPVTFGDDPGYLVYTPTDNDPGGHFEMDLGGMIWVSKINPQGEACPTRTLTKKEGDYLLDLIREENKNNNNNKER